MSNLSELPHVIVVDLWRLWHKRLSDTRKSSLNTKRIFLLEGSSFNSVYPGYFEQPINQRSEIEFLINEPSTTAVGRWFQSVLDVFF